MIPRTLLSWALELFNSSLPRNMFPANLVEATFKQVSGSPDNREVAGRANLSPAGKWQVYSASPPVLGGRMLEGREGGGPRSLELCSLGHTPALGSSFAQRKTVRVEHHFPECCSSLGFHRAYTLTVSLSLHKNLPSNRVRLSPGWGNWGSED